VTPAELVAEGFRLSRLLEGARSELLKRAKAAAETEKRYRHAKSEAWARSAGNGMIAKEREAWVDAETADLRYERDLARGVHQSALEAQRSLRTEISYVQSALGVERAEAEFARTGP
jgi:hypothetical protein